MTKLGAAFGDWYGARLAGIAIALTLTAGVAPAASAAQGDPRKPETAPNGGPGPQGNPGSPRAQKVRSDRAPKPPGPKSKQAKPKPAPPRSTKAEAVEPRPPKPRPAKPRARKPERVKPESSHAPPPQAKAGKTTICHSTGSATNPYVEITVSSNALSAHGRHHDGRDIIPAPAIGCPAGIAADLSEEVAQAQPGKTTICHSTGSSTNRFVEITISNNALDAHARHHARHDVIPAPSGGCGGVSVAAERIATGGSEMAAEVLGQARSGESEEVGAAPRATAERQGAGEGGVLGARATGGAAPSLAEEEATARDDDGGSLPFTGLALLGILATAALALGGGMAARRATTNT